LGVTVNWKRPASSFDLPKGKGLRNAQKKEEHGKAQNTEREDGNSMHLHKTVEMSRGLGSKFLPKAL